MSIIHCVGCDTDVDTDYKDTMPWSDGEICEDCYGPQQLAIKDYAMGGGFSDNPYDKDDFNYLWYQEKMHDLMYEELRNAIKALRGGKC